MTHVKSGSTQTAKVLLTLDVRTPGKLYGFDPVLQKMIQQEKRELKLLKRYIDVIVWNTFRGILKSTLSIELLFHKNFEKFDCQKI